MKRWRLAAVILTGMLALGLTAQQVQAAGIVHVEVLSPHGCVLPRQVRDGIGIAQQQALAPGAAQSEEGDE